MRARAWVKMGVAVAALTSTVGLAQTQGAPKQAGGDLASSLGVSAYPAQGQTPQQQQADEGACYSWAKQQTGIDPMQLAQAGTQAAPPPSTGAARGAARGAALGAAGGAIAGDAGKGAAVGATVGGAGGAMRRRGQEAQNQANAQAQSAQNSQQIATFNKSFSACLDGKGYTTK